MYLLTTRILSYSWNSSSKHKTSLQVLMINLYTIAFTTRNDIAEWICYYKRKSPRVCQEDVEKILARWRHVHSIHKSHNNWIAPSLYHSVAGDHTISGRVSSMSSIPGDLIPSWQSNNLQLNPHIFQYSISFQLYNL